MSDPKHEVVAGRLISTGDGRRGLPPCQACHGPIGFVVGAPSLATQNATYLLEQLEAFASGRQANDINLRMRSITTQVTEEARHALAESYGAGVAGSGSRLAGKQKPQDAFFLSVAPAPICCWTCALTLSAMACTCSGGIP